MTSPTEQPTDEPTDQKPERLLRLERVRKQFGDNQVLRGLDLKVDEHEVVCLIGASGSGKSTLLRCVNLLETVDDGTVWFADR
ncbi:MAG TPA: ATP-binding cassette domain-containing protein, partial [Nocardioidaceae bacterium]|nr:ATP-binding cassette domain-containing protein [Nocardioidaceae bacterium]